MNHSDYIDLKSFRAGIAEREGISVEDVKCKNCMFCKNNTLIGRDKIVDKYCTIYGEETYGWGWCGHFVDVNSFDYYR